MAQITIPLTYEEDAKMKRLLEPVPRDPEALATLLQALRDWPADVAFHAAAYRHLRSVHWTRAQQDAAGAAGALEVMCASLSRHAAHAEVQEHACGALRNLLAGHLSNQERAGAAGAAPLLVATLLAFPTGVAVLRQALDALDSLTMAPVNVPRVVAAEGTAVLAATLRDHRDSRFIQTSGASVLARLTLQ